MGATGFPGGISAHGRDAASAAVLFGQLPSADSIFQTIRDTATHYGDLFSGAVGAGLSSVATVFGLGPEDPGMVGYTRSIGGVMAPATPVANADEKVAKGDDSPPTSTILSSGTFLVVASALGAYLLIRRF